MKATIEIDDDLYSWLETEAKSRGCNVTDVVAEAVRRILTIETPSAKRRIRPRLIDSGRPGKLNIPDDIVSRLDMSS